MLAEFVRDRPFAGLSRRRRIQKDPELAAARNEERERTERSCGLTTPASDIEQRLLLEAIYEIYHYDFRQYAAGSLRRAARPGTSAGPCRWSSLFICRSDLQRCCRRCSGICTINRSVHVATGCAGRGVARSAQFFAGHQERGLVAHATVGQSR